nr:hypothetical protein [uncultured Halomonas sp.]
MSRVFHVRYGDNDTVASLLERQSHRLGLTPEQYIRRLVARDLGDIDLPNHSPVPGDNWVDFLHKNGALTHNVGFSV